MGQDLKKLNASAIGGLSPAMSFHDYLFFYEVSEGMEIINELAVSLALGAEHFCVHVNHTQMMLSDGSLHYGQSQSVLTPGTAVMCSLLKATQQYHCLRRIGRRRIKFSCSVSRSQHKSWRKSRQT